MPACLYECMSGCMSSSENTFLFLGRFWSCDLAIQSGAPTVKILHNGHVCAESWVLGLQPSGGSPLSLRFCLLFFPPLTACACSAFTKEGVRVDRQRPGAQIKRQE